MKELGKPKSFRGINLLIDKMKTSKSVDPKETAEILEFLSKTLQQHGATPKKHSGKKSD